MTLSNNRDFEAWTVSDWIDSLNYSPEKEVPQWNDSLRKSWSEDFTEPEDFNSPMYELVSWRASYGMETMIAFRRRLAIAFTPAEEYEMCSPNTQNLAEILINYSIYSCCDDRSYNFYPLLDRIIDWMVEFYGTKNLSV